MQLNSFNGGLNTRLAPERIAFNEATVCENIDPSSADLKAVNSLAAFPHTEAKKNYYFKAKNKLMPSAHLRDYLEYQGNLYWTDGTKPRKQVKGKEYDLGVIAPTFISAAIGAAGRLTGTYSYVYTYYNRLDGTESAPSPVSADVIAVSQQINITLQASSDPQVTNIRLYRVGGNTTIFSLVKTVLNVDQVYIDNKKDSLLTIALTAQDNSPPPNKLRYLTEEYGTFFGAVGSKLYYSRDIGNPNYWPAVNYIDFHTTITAIAKAPIGIVVFTETQCFGLSGTTAAGFRKYLLSGTQGCIEHKTVVNVNNLLFFVSTDGICILNGANVVVASRNKVGKLALDPICAVTFDDAYYCQLRNKKILVFDTRYQPAMYYLNFNTDWLFIQNDTLYMENTSSAYEAFQGPPATYVYETGELTEGSSSAVKIYSTIFCQVKGTVNLEVFIDGTSVLAKELVGKTLPLQVGLPQRTQRGSSIRFRITGTGTVKSIIYKAELPQNG